MSNFIQPESIGNDPQYPCAFCAKPVLIQAAVRDGDDLFCSSKCRSDKSICSELVKEWPND